MSGGRREETPELNVALDAKGICYHSIIASHWQASIPPRRVVALISPINASGLDKIPAAVAAAAAEAARIMTSKAAQKGTGFVEEKKGICHIGTLPDFHFARFAFSHL